MTHAKPFDPTQIPTDKPIAIVTGGGSGIGLAIVHDLARDHTVIATGRDSAKLARLAEVANVIPVQLDLMAPQDILAFAAAFTHLDVLVNCAALSDWKSLEQARQSDWEVTFQTNVFAPAELTRALLPALRASKGQVVFISSGAGVRPVKNHIVYTASKHALRGLTDTLRLEEVANGVRIATVAPGPTDTDQNRANRAATAADGIGAAAEGELSDPASVAKGVRVVIDTPRDSQITDLVIRPLLL
ncbi:SDR family oxidoreductase [Ketogulonicigenium robustum]|uniref:SDR family oxidoreductase n=1 Tax=Ketogulonicigenium robustum TaxID=92947 RepID=UPI0018DB7F6A|nr:SDR family oxidoreductase [Ketogulonicigenium robustum]